MFKSINGGRLPERATRYSAGFDVFSNEDVVIGAGETKMIGLGIAIDQFQCFEMCYGKVKRDDFIQQFYLALHIRSSLRAKGLTSLGTGIIDMDYRDEIKMVIHNPMSISNIFLHKGKDFMLGDTKIETLSMNYLTNGGYTIKKGDKIGQLILCRHEGYLLPSEYTKDEERNGGFGSTGK